MREDGAVYFSLRGGAHFISPNRSLLHSTPSEMPLAGEEVIAAAKRIHKIPVTKADFETIKAGNRHLEWSDDKWIQLEWFNQTQLSAIALLPPLKNVGPIREAGIKRDCCSLWMVRKTGFIIAVYPVVKDGKIVSGVYHQVTNQQARGIYSDDRTKADENNMAIDPETGREYFVLPSALFAEPKTTPAPKDEGAADAPSPAKPARSARKPSKAAAAKAALAAAESMCLFPPVTVTAALFALTTAFNTPHAHASVRPAFFCVKPVMLEDIAYAFDVSDTSLHGYPMNTLVSQVVDLTTARMTGRRALLPESKALQEKIQYTQEVDEGKNILCHVPDLHSSISSSSSSAPPMLTTTVKRGAPSSKSSDNKRGATESAVAAASTSAAAAAAAVPDQLDRQSVSTRVLAKTPLLSTGLLSESGTNNIIGTPAELSTVPVWIVAGQLIAMRSKKSELDKMAPLVAPLMGTAEIPPVLNTALSTLNAVQLAKATAVLKPAATPIVKDLAVPAVYLGVASAFQFGLRAQLTAELSTAIAEVVGQEAKEFDAKLAAMDAHIKAVEERAKAAEAAIAAEKHSYELLLAEVKAERDVAAAQAAKERAAKERADKEAADAEAERLAAEAERLAAEAAKVPAVDTSVLEQEEQW